MEIYFLCDRWGADEGVVSTVLVEGSTVKYETPERHPIQFCHVYINMYSTHLIDISLKIDL